MSAPDPEGIGLLAKFLGACAAIGVPIGAGWKYHKHLEEKLDRKADKETLEGIQGELSTQRQRIVEVFEQIRGNESKSEQRHRELLMHLLERK